MFKAMFKNEEGATLVEYGIALTLAILVGAGAFATLANNTSANVGAAANALVVNGVTY